jgi:hypothetical protein
LGKGRSLPESPFASGNSEQLKLAEESAVCRRMDGNRGHLVLEIRLAKVLTGYSSFAKLILPPAELYFVIHAKYDKRVMIRRPFFKPGILAASQHEPGECVAGLNGSL